VKTTEPDYYSVQQIAELASCTPQAVCQRLTISPPIGLKRSPYRVPRYAAHDLIEAIQRTKASRKPWARRDVSA